MSLFSKYGLLRHPLKALLFSGDLRVSYADWNVAHKKLTGERIVVYLSAAAHPTPQQHEAGTKTTMFSLRLAFTQPPIMGYL